MPIYEFQCQACGNEIEVIQKVSDPHPTDCEACGKSEMRKKVTAAAFRLSGAGWYETDFKKDSDKKKNLTESNDKSDKKKSADSSEGSKKDSTAKSSSSDSKTSAKPKNKESSKSDSN